MRADAPKLLPLLATAAAVGATAITVRHVMQRQRQGAPAQQQQRQRERPSGGGSGGGSSSSAASWAAALASRQVQGLTFGWPLQSREQKKERQLLATVRAGRLGSVPLLLRWLLRLDAVLVQPAAHQCPSTWFAMWRL